MTEKIKSGNSQRRSEMKCLPPSARGATRQTGLQPET